MVDEGAVPTSVLLQGELPSGYALQSPVRVVIWREGDEYVADPVDVDLHAFGSDAEAALNNLAERLVDQWRRLSELGEKLAPRTQAERERLSAVLVPVAARA